MPTLMGYDQTIPRSLGEVGRERGPSRRQLRNMGGLFHGIPLADVTTSMTINAPAIYLPSAYIAVGESQGVGPHRRGTLQNDMLQRSTSRRRSGSRRSARRCASSATCWCTAPKRCRCGTPSASAATTSAKLARQRVQELAFTLADGIMCSLARKRGRCRSVRAATQLLLRCAQRLLGGGRQVRAARRIWARTMRERFGAKRIRARGCCGRMPRRRAFFADGQQPLNNVVRVTMQALAAVLGGTQSLHTNSYDETFALPTEDAVTLALRTQQIIA